MHLTRKKTGLVFHQTSFAIQKPEEPRFRRAGKVVWLIAPGKTEPAGVQGVVRQNEPGALRRRQPAFDEGEI